MEIKTIRNRLDNAGEFDKEVNAALAAGWRLIKREYINPRSQGATNYTHIMLYAELVKDDPPKEAAPAPKKITWEEAVRVLRDMCRDIPGKDCYPGGCPMYRFCERYLLGGGQPETWEVPGDE